MTFEDLVEQIKKIRCQETRSFEKNYVEVVVEQSHLKSMLNTLGSYFGLPLKPEGEAPSEAARTYASPYGGIFSNQTLYYRESSPAQELALLWPWGSGAAVTVKLIRKN